MKNIFNNLLNTILILILILFSGYFLYKTYDSYKRYKIVQKSEKSIKFIGNINKAIQSIEDEASLSAIYLGYNGKADFSELESKRKESDSALDNCKLFIENNPVFTPYNKILDSVSNSLQYTRSRVDVISNDYKSVLFDYYQNEAIEPLVKIVDETLQELTFGLEKLKNYISIYQNFIDFQDSINKEKSFIAYIVANSKKMENQDLALWDKIIENQILPNYQQLDKKTVIKLNRVLEKEIFLQSQFNNRVKISKGILNGLYPINSTQWIENIDKNINKILKSKNILYQVLKDKTENIKVSPNELIINIIISLLLLLMLFNLINSIKNEKKAKKEFRKSKIKRRRASDMHHHDDMIDIRSPNIKETTKKSNIFNPVEEFETIIDEFEKKAERKKIAVHYYIDPNVPTASIGNLKQIKQIISNLLNHALGTTKSYGTIKIRVENSANKESESAIRFSVIESDTHISREYKNKIMRYFFNEELVKSPKISTKKTDLITTAKLVANMDGIFEISNSEKAGAILSFAVSLKKVNSKKQESLVA